MMAILPLSDVATIIMGQSPPGHTYNTESDGLPFFQGKAEFGEESPTPVKWCSAPQRIAEPGDILLSVRAPVGPTNFAVERCCIGRGLAALRPDPVKLLTGFLRYFLVRFEAQIARQGVGSTFTAINKRDVESMKVPVPPLKEQEHIVRILDEADGLRKLRVEADRRTADLIPSIFHDMFGDPARNDKKWDLESVGNLYTTHRHGARCGPFGSALKKHEYVDDGIPVWGIDNVLPNMFIEDGSLFITPEKYDQLTNYNVEDGDILISRAGTVGRMCVARLSQFPSIIGTNLIRLSLNPDRVVPEYFTSLFTYFPERVSRLRSNVDEGAYSFMKTSVLKSLVIPVPPMPIQREFAARVAEVREMEAKQAASRRRLDDLFQSLLHRAFQGEL